MAIATEFIDFIVPIHLIEKKYPGGWEQCLKDHQGLLNGRVWFDQYLFRDGAMNPADIEALVQRWNDMGFECLSEADGKKCWKDVCVYEGMFGGVTLECEWLAIDKKTRSVYLSGTEVGDVVYPKRGEDE